MRLFTFLLAAVGLIWGFWQGIVALWVAGIVLLVVFFGLVRYHNIVGRLKRRYEELYKLKLTRRETGSPEAGASCLCGTHSAQLPAMLTRRTSTSSDVPLSFSW